MFRVVYLVSLLAGSAAFRMSRNANRVSAQFVSTVDDKAEVSEYFNNEGFQRWNKVSTVPFRRLYS
jgi:hypothetical protein